MVFCQTCGKMVYRGVIGGMNDYFEEYPVFRFPGSHNGGTFTAVIVHGVYRKHSASCKSAGYSSVLPKFLRRKKPQRRVNEADRIRASVRRQRLRRRIPVSSGKV